MCKLCVYDKRITKTIAEELGYCLNCDDCLEYDVDKYSQYEMEDSDESDESNKTD